MEYFIFFLIALGVIYGYAAVQSNKFQVKPKCDLHKWDYLEAGGMKCKACGFIAGTEEQENI